MRSLRRIIIGCCCLESTFALVANAQEIALVPISASGVHTIVGDEIILEGGGQRVTLEIRLVDWDADLDGVPSLGAWQATIDSSGYTSGLRGTLAPAVEACASDADCEAVLGTGSSCNSPPGAGVECAPGFIDVSRSDYVFACCLNLSGVETSTLDFRFAAITLFMGATDSGAPQYGGTLVLDVPTEALGTFTVPFLANPERNMRDQNLDPIIPVILAPALITVNCQTNADCDDGNACTDDTCLGDGTCANNPNFNQATECCDPVTGVPTVIDDGIECTDDVCDASTGVVTHDPLPAGTACGSPLDTECDAADSCDGFGTCLANVAPPGQACGDSTTTDCTNPDTCDGFGVCIANDLVDGTVCADEPNDCTDDVCVAGACTHPNKAAATPCGDPATTDCTNPDSCDGAGVCLANDLADGTVCTDEPNDCTDDVCAAGVCTHPILTAGTACGDSTATACTAADTCDKLGTCQANDAPAGTMCPDDLNDCTDDVCDGAGACTHPNKAAGAACGDGTETQCDKPDTCDGAGVCLENFESLGTSCGDPSSDQCDNPDTCNGSGVCDGNFVAGGTPCDDADVCTGTGQPDIGIDTCDGAGACTGTFDPVCNDDCAHALPAIEGPNPGNNDNRGPDNAEASCQPDSNNDVWWVFTAPCDGLVFVSTTGSQFAPSNDPVLSVHNGCPDAGGIEIACADDSGVDLQAALSFTATAGITYWFRVAGFMNNTGDVVLNITINDDCVIGDRCFAEGTINPDNDCEACLSGISNIAWSPRPEGSSCGDPSDTECDSPDACDGSGVCEVNPKPDGTACTDDGNECTFDECLAGACSHPPVPVGEPCGDPSDSTCDHPDSCDGTGVCLDNFESAGTPCGDSSSDQCNNPDICDGVGLCDDNLVPDGTLCDDTDDCTGPDTCRAGVCVGDPIPEAPIVNALGSRYLSVAPVPAGSAAPVALRLTSSTWPCIVKYVAPDGLLTDAPISMLPDEWGTVFPHGPEVTPSATYSVEAECGSFRSNAGSATTALWGDTVGVFDGAEWTPPNGSVEITDLLAIVEGFIAAETAPELQRVDLWPCVPDRVIDIRDLVFAIDAFQGLSFPCDPPCLP